MSQLIDFVLHFDKHLLEFVQQYGTWVYGILFAIVFAETGLVVTPFLPGDSLLFAVGALSATGVLNPWLCYVLLIGAAILGDGVNYSIGRRIGPRLLGIGDGPAFSHRLINAAAHQARPRVLRAARRKGGRARPLRAHRPHVPAVRGGRSGDERQLVPLLQHHGRHRLGDDLHGRRVSLRQRARSSKTTSRWSRIGIVIVSVLPMVFEVLKHRRAKPVASSRSS